MKIRWLVTLTLLILFFTSLPTYAEDKPHQGIAADFLFEIGVGHYYEGNYEQAIHELKKVLLIAPEHEMAQAYLKKAEDALERLRKGVRREEILGAMEEARAKLAEEEKLWVEEEVVVEKEVVEEEAVEVEVIEEEVVEIERPPVPAKLARKPVKVSGEYGMSLGVTKDDLIWKKANWDLNEKDWRVVDAQSDRENTFDTRIYDHVRVNVDTENEQGFNFHTNITLDPWSFTGKTNRMTVTGSGGDLAEVELKYWSNYRSTINETVYTLVNGGSISVPEIKVIDGETVSMPVANTWNETFTIPGMEIKREFQPIRELWFDYVAENWKFRLFPIAYQDQALSSDDPLKLSNHMIYWEESPWLDEWRPGIENGGVSPVDFSRGEWDDELSYFTRDSTGTRLTSLRGFSLESDALDNTFINLTCATPKGLWQDYDSVNSLEGAMRLKHYLMNELMVGGVYTFKMGYTEGKRDAINHVLGLDFDYDILPNINIKAEVATSRSKQDITSDYDKKSEGNAWQVVVGADKEADYERSRSQSPKSFPTFKTRLVYTHMDEGFEPGLASYRRTREDPYWGRHIRFKKPYKEWYGGLYYPTLTWWNVEPFRIGDSIDIGRDVIGFRAEAMLLEGKLDSLIDIRNAHKTKGKYVETVGRAEATYEVTPKLTSKFLLIYQDMPDTIGGKDPFVYDPDTGEFYTNSAIEDGKDPSLATYSAGLKYQLLDWLSIDGVYELTNDSTVGMDDFPRRLLDDTTFATKTEDGHVIRYESPYLNSQGFFDLPPYEYFNVYKLGLELQPIEPLRMRLEFTKNDYKYAGQIDDNINHFSLKADYDVTEKLSLGFKYTYAKSYDIYQQYIGKGLFYEDHYNVSANLAYKVKENGLLMVQYGVSEIGPIAAVATSPYPDCIYPTLDTQNIFRIYYTEAF